MVPRLVALFNALIAGIAQRRHFIAVQQSVRLRDVGNVARSAHDGVNDRLAGWAVPLLSQVVPVTGTGRPRNRSDGMDVPLNGPIR